MKKSKVYYQKLPLHCRETWMQFLNDFPAKGSISYVCGSYLAAAGVMGAWEPESGPEAFMPIIRKISTNGKGRPAFELRIVAINEADRIIKSSPEFKRVKGFPVCPDYILDDVLTEIENGINKKEVK